MVYAFRITWSELVFESSPSLSSRRHYDQEGLGRRPYKNLENFFLMINNLRVIIINSKGTVHISRGGGGGGMRKILGVKEGRPKIPPSFAVMASVSNAKSLPKTCKNAKSMRSYVQKVQISHGSIPPDPTYRFLSVAYSFV